jgi:hypothetical protein
MTEPTDLDTVVTTQPAKATKIEKLLEAKKGVMRRMWAPTSRQDIQHMMNNKVRVVSYKELEQFKTLDELLDPYQCVVLLYPNYGSEDVGHWCCLFSNSSNSYLEFFDAYGCFIDDKIAEFDERQEDDKSFHKPRKIEPKLIELILASNYGNVHFNDMPYQSTKYDTNTCGLWCVARLKNKHLNEETFQKLYLELPLDNNQLPDMTLSNLIGNLYPEMRVN